MGWDAGSIEATADIDLSPFHHGLERAKAEAREFADKRYTATVDIDTKRSSDELAAVEQRLHSIESTVDRIGAKTGGAGGGGGGGGGRGGVAGGGRGGIFSRLPNPSWMALGIGAAIPAAVPFAGLAGGIAGGALSAGVTGGLGLGAFGLGAKHNIATITGDITKLNKLTGQYNAATTNKQRAAVLVKEQALWKALDPAQRAAVKNVQALDSAWASYKKKLEPQTFAVVSDGAKIANTGLKYLLPTAQAVGDEIDSMAQRAERAFKAPFWHQFFGAFLPGEAARSVDALGTTLGHVGTGVAHLVQDFAPLAHLLEGGSTSLSARFEKWTEGAGPGKFVAWVEKEGPPAAEALGSLAKGVKGLAEGFAPIGQLELKALTPILNFLGKLGDEHPAVITALGGALLTLGAGLKAVKLVGSIPGLGRIGGGGGGGLGGGGIIGKGTPVPVYVTNWGGGGLPGGPGLPGGGRKPPEPGTGVPVGGTALHDLKTGGKLLRAGDLAEGGRMILQGAARSPIDPLAVVLAAITRGSTPYPDAPNIDYQHRLAHSTIGQQRVAGQTLSRLQNPSNFPGTDVPTAVGTIVKYGSPAQLQQLQALADKDKTVAAAFARLGTSARTSANDLDNAKSSVAHLRAEFAVLGPALLRSLGALQKLPGYLRTAETAASSGGFVIGKNLTAGIIIGIRQGQDKVAIQMVSVVKGALHAGRTTAQLGSPSKITTQYGRWIAEGLAVGFAQQMPHVQALFGKHTASALGQIRSLAVSRLASARQQLTSDQQNRAGLISSISGGLLGAANIGGAINAAGGTDSIGGFLGGVNNTEGRLLADLRRLKAKRLNPALLEQIAEQSPAQGLGLAESILGGRSGSVSSINSRYATAVRTSGQIGSLVGGAVYAGQIGRDQHLVTVLEALANALKHQPDVVVKINDREIARANRSGSAKLARAHS